MEEIEKLQSIIAAFRNSRDWKQFHNAKDLAISLSIESTELLELFQWKSRDEVDLLVKNDKESIEDELADIFYYLLLISNDLDINLERSLLRKLKKNEEKYPVHKAKGNHKKYTEL